MRKLKIQDRKEKYTFTIEIEKQEYDLLKDYEYSFEGNMASRVHMDALTLIECIKNYERVENGKSNQTN